MRHQDDGDLPQVGREAGNGNGNVDSDVPAVLIHVGVGEELRRVLVDRAGTTAYATLPGHLLPDQVGELIPADPIDEGTPCPAGWVVAFYAERDVKGQLLPQVFFVAAAQSVPSDDSADLMSDEFRVG